jgi:hypothetical protein
LVDRKISIWFLKPSKRLGTHFRSTDSQRRNTCGCSGPAQRFYSVSHAPRSCAQQLGPEIFVHRARRPSSRSPLPLRHITRPLALPTRPTPSPLPQAGQVGAAVVVDVEGRPDSDSLSSSQIPKDGPDSDSDSSPSHMSGDGSSGGDRWEPDLSGGRRRAPPDQVLGNVTRRRTPTRHRRRCRRTILAARTSGSTTLKLGVAVYIWGC